jgi:hypothetical protein
VRGREQDLLFITVRVACDDFKLVSVDVGDGTDLERAGNGGR